MVTWRRRVLNVRNSFETHALLCFGSSVFHDAFGCGKYTVLLILAAPVALICDAACPYGGGILLSHAFGQLSLHLNELLSFALVTWC